MAISLRNFSHNEQLSSTVGVLVPVVPNNTKSVVRKLSFYNSGAVEREITLYVVESGGVADTGTTIVVKSITPGTTWNVAEVRNEVLETGMSLQAKQDAGTDVNANCSGADIT